MRQRRATRRRSLRAPAECPVAVVGEWAASRRILRRFSSRAIEARLQMALAEAARQGGLNQIRFFMQRGLYARRMMEAMGLEALEQLTDQLAASADAAARGRAERLEELREKLRLEVRDYVEKQLKLFTANTGRQLREEVLQQIRLSNVDFRDLKLMRELLRKMAKRLVALHSRRRKVARRGHLDVRRTIRANIEFDGLLFHTMWKRKKIDRPKVMALCDVSGSVAAVARFLLMFLYSVQEVLPEVRSFCFSGKLGEVTEQFEKMDIEAAAEEALRLYGGSSNYGQAFADFEALALDDIDHRTTVLILGDARSNYSDPRADILHKVHERARRVLFLNPEPRQFWRIGDSEMRRFVPYCDRAATCASLRIWSAWSPSSCGRRSEARGRPSRRAHSRTGGSARWRGRRSRSPRRHGEGRG